MTNATLRRGSLFHRELFFRLVARAIVVLSVGIAQADTGRREVSGPASRPVDSGEVAAAPFTVLPLGIGMDKTTEAIAETIRDVHARAGVSRVVLHAPGHGVRILGYYDEAGYRAVGRRVKTVQDAVRTEGVEVGFLMGPTMNVGIGHPWTKFIMKDGRERPFTACPGDPVFRKAFAAHCAAVAGECRPFLYMMEDDFRLFGDGCFCERHRAKPAQAFEDLVLLAREAAEAIHRVSPATRIGLSAPGGYRREAARLARALADGGRPFIRWYGTDYGFDNPMRLPDFLWTPLWCRQNLSDGMDCVYEADAAPNTAFYGSGARVAACAAVTLANGFDGLWYWLAGVGSTRTGEPVPNLEAYARVRRDLAVIGLCGHEGVPVGVSAMSAPAGRLLARMGVPYRTTAGGVEMYAGGAAFAGRSDDELRRILSRRILIDGDAAKVLTARGFSAEIGARARNGSVGFNAECVRADGTVIVSTFHQNYGLDGSSVAWLEPMGGEEISYYYSRTPSNRVQSAAIRHANALGGRVVTLATALTDCTATNVLNFRKRRLLLEAFDWLGGASAVPVRTDTDVNVLVFANEDAARTRLFVHATQLSCDPLDALTLVVMPPYRGGRVEYLREGEWIPLAAAWQGAKIVIPRPMHVYDTQAVRIRSGR